MVDALGRRHGDGPVDGLANIHETRECDHPSVDGADRHRADLPGLEKVDGVAEDLTFDVFMETLEEQASRAWTTSRSTPACAWRTFR